MAELIAEALWAVATEFGTEAAVWTLGNAALVNTALFVDATYAEPAEPCRVQTSAQPAPEPTA